MGVNRRHVPSRSTVSSGTSYTVDPRNPNPAKFKVVKTVQAGDYLVAMISYDGVTNYEGKKVLVFEGLTASGLKEARNLDPHFQEKKGPTVPIARFVPDKDGWITALLFANMMKDLLP